MTTFVVVTPLPNGTLANLDGTVRSLNPVGTVPETYVWQARPAGTAGAFEAMVIHGNVAVYNPTLTQPVCFAYAPAVPNATGAALGLEPL